MFARSHRFIHSARGWGRAGVALERSFIGRFSMFWIGLVLVFYAWEIDLLPEYLQYWPHDV